MYATSIFVSRVIYWKMFRGMQRVKKVGPTYKGTFLENTTPITTFFAIHTSNEILQ